MTIRHTSDKQAQFLIEREMENCSSASKIKAKNKDNPFDIKKASALVIYQDEQSGDLRMQLEIKEARKRTNPEERPVYDTYVITGEQLDAMCKDADTKSKMYDLLSQYKENGDVYACYGDETRPKRYEQYKGTAFGADVKPNNIEDYTPTGYLDKCSYALSEVCENNKDSFKREHPKGLIMYDAKYETVDPKYAMIPPQDTDFEAVYQATGIKPVVISANRELLDHDEPQNPGEKYAYIKGYKIVARESFADCKSPQEVRNRVRNAGYNASGSKMSSNTYLVNYYMGNSQVDHSLIVGPDYMTELMKVSQVKFENDSKTHLIGYTNAPMYETNHAYTKGYTKESYNPKQDDIMNAFTNDSVSRFDRKTKPIESVMYEKPAKGTVRGINIYCEVAEKPNLEITDDLLKLERRNQAIAGDALKKHNESVSPKSKINQANHTGSQVSQFDIDNEMPFN